MRELEVKILEINTEKIIQKLEGLGAKKVFDGEIKTLFFDFQDNRISKTKDVLRLRKSKNEIKLTYKKSSTTQTAKQAEEYSVKVSSVESIQKILEFIGLRVTEDMLKHRVSHKLGSVRFDIDRFLGAYKFVPEFLEIEAENVDLIFKNAELLGFEAKDCLPWSTEELIKYYSEKTHFLPKQRNYV